MDLASYQGCVRRVGATRGGLNGVGFWSSNKEVAVSDGSVATYGGLHHDDDYLPFDIPILIAHQVIEPK